MVRAVDDFDYNTYTRLLADFCNEDLSAFYFDIRKDVLYCDLGPAAPLGTDTRRAYRSVLDILFHELRSEEHTSELQSLMRNSYAVFCLKKKNRELTQITHSAI